MKGCPFPSLLWVQLHHLHHMLPAPRSVQGPVRPFHQQSAYCLMAVRHQVRLVITLWHVVEVDHLLPGDVIPVGLQPHGGNVRRLAAIMGTGCLVSSGVFSQILECTRDMSLVRQSVNSDFLPDCLMDFT